jgi:hypothetical protein
MTAAFHLELSPSRRARQAHRLAAVLTVATAASCIVAFVLSPSGVRAAAILATLSATAFVATRSAASSAGSLDLAADGTVRVDADGRNQSASVGYCGAQLICLRTSTSSVRVWPDALGATEWRRLQVACRWPRGQGGSVDAGKRTK